VVARVRVAADRVPEDVAAAAAAALVDAWSFERVEFGQAVHLSAVYAVLQAAPGVVGADVTALEIRDPAQAAERGAGTGAGAHLPIFGHELATLAAGDVTVGAIAEPGR
jgi:hypothetical protein